jgi:hypothetical protein
MHGTGVIVRKFGWSGQPDRYIILVHQPNFR